MLAGFGVTATETNVGLFVTGGCTVNSEIAASVPLEAVMTAFPWTRPTASPLPLTEAVVDGTENQLTELVRFCELPSV